MHSSRHKLHIIYGSLGCLAKVIEEVGLIHILESLGHAIGGLCHFHANFCGLCYKILQFAGLISDEVGKFGDSISYNHSIYLVTGKYFLEALGILFQFCHSPTYLLQFFLQHIIRLRVERLRCVVKFSL